MKKPFAALVLVTSAVGAMGCGSGPENDVLVNVGGGSVAPETVSCGSTSDNANCGVCGRVCGAGLGCVNGTCLQDVTYPTPGKCFEGGPAITIGAPNPCAESLFPQAICSCTDETFLDPTTIDGFDSSVGAYDPLHPRPTVGIGANREIVASDPLDVWGSATAASPTTGVSASSTFHVRRDLLSNGAIGGYGEIDVNGNAFVNGNVTGKGKILHTLYQTPGKTRPAKDFTWASVFSAPVSVSAPCNCTSKLDVVAYVAGAKVSNDNALIGLDPSVLATNAPPRLDLPCGNYYLKGFSLTKPTTIVTHGNTAIYIDGDVNTTSFLEITHDSSSSLDLLISGTYRTWSTTKLGTPAHPATTRVYIGGTAQVTLNDVANVGANLYAPNAKVVTEGRTEWFGSIFAANFEALDPLKLHRDDFGTCSPPAPLP